MQISITVRSVFQLMFSLTGELLRDSTIEALEPSSGYCERRPTYFHYRCRRLLQNGTQSSRCIGIVESDFYSTTLNIPGLETRVGTLYARGRHALSTAGVACMF